MILIRRHTGNHPGNRPIQHHQRQIGWKMLSQRPPCAGQRHDDQRIDPALRHEARCAVHQPDAIVCTNNFLGQGVLDAMVDAESPPIIGCFDEIPMMHLLRIPIVCSNQDVPRLAEACVEQLLPMLRGEQAPEPAATILPAHVITNNPFDARVVK